MPLSPPLFELTSDSENEIIDVVSYDDNDKTVGCGDGDSKSNDNDNDVSIVYEKFQTGEVIECEESGSLASTESVIVESSTTASTSVPENSQDVSSAREVLRSEYPIDYKMGKQSISKKSKRGTQNVGDAIEVMQPITTIPRVSKSKPSVEYVLFYDPALDGLEGSDSGVADDQIHSRGNDENGVRELSEDSKDASDQSHSPQPSTSKRSCGGKRKRRGSNATREESSPKKQLRFCDINDNAENVSSMEKNIDSDDDVSSNGKINKSNLRRKKNQLISSGDDSSSSLFEAVTVRQKITKSPSSSRKSGITDENGQLRTKRLRKRRSRVIRKSNSSSSASETQEEEDPERSSPSEDDENKNESDTASMGRAATRSRRNTDKSKRDRALELLRQRREMLASKPKRVIPEKTLPQNVEDAEDSESSYTTGSSPCPVVDESSPDGSDFDCSTPSESSVTSSGETDEEPDLQIGGSDGEKELVKENGGDTSDDSNKDDASVKSYTSSDDETPDDGQNDERCILCKNLGLSVISGRANSSEESSWCKCGECKIFSNEANDYDLVCCQEIKTVVDFLNYELDDSNVCVTKHPRFAYDVLMNEGYARSISKHAQPKRFQTRFWGNFFENYTCGKADYRAAEDAQNRFFSSSPYGKYTKCLSSYLHWIFDQLGCEAGQMVIPACVQNKILREFGIPRDQFYSFRSKFKCEIGRHCRLSK